MDRRSFLGRVGVAGLALLGADKLLQAAPSAAAPAVATETWTDAWAVSPADPLGDILAAAAKMKADGGLCAPLSPYYTLHFSSDLYGTPLSDALPLFKADRGGIVYRRNAPSTSELELA